MIKSIELFLTYKCNYNCSFCFEKDFSKEIFVLEENNIYKKIKNAYNDGFNHIVFSGGEPTLVQNIKNYIKYSKEIGFRYIIIHTNGFLTSNYNYLLELYENGLTGIFLSIHGVGKLNDIIVNYKGSFHHIKETLINVYNIRKKIDVNFTIDTNTVICNYNYNRLLQVIKYLNIFKVGRIAFTYPNSSAIDFINIDYLIPYDLVVSELEKIFLYVEEKNVKDFRLQGIPFCFIKEKYHRFILVEDIIKVKNTSSFIEDDKYELGFKKIDKCNSCKLQNKCFGYSKIYLKKFKI